MVAIDIQKGFARSLYRTVKKGLEDESLTHGCYCVVQSTVYKMAILKGSTTRIFPQ